MNSKSQDAARLAATNENKHPLPSDGRKPSISFSGGYSATLTVPVDQAAAYALLKTQQIAALNGLIASHVSGCPMDFTENEIWAFAELAGELAHQAHELFAGVEDSRARREGGA